MADTLGDAQMRLLIIEYRARLALLDMKKWTEASRKLVNDNFGSSIGSEWQPYKINVDPWIVTPYAKTTDSSGYLIPEARATPGWSGANLVPLRVNGSSVSVSFRPLGPNMTLQLCYRATDGTSVYSAPVSSGKATLRLVKPPTNNVVIAVVCNTDYKYLGEATRKAHYDYRLKPESGIAGTADVNRKWYDVKMVETQEVRQKPTEVRKNLIQIPGRFATDFDLRMESGSVRVDFTLTKSGPIQLSLNTASGALVTHLFKGMREAGVYQEKIDLSQIALPEATFLVTLQSGANHLTRSMTLPR